MNDIGIRQDSFTTKLLVKLAKMVAEDLQTKAPGMSVDELYENSDFLPTYSKDKNYSEKPSGYTCKTESGVIMRLTDPAMTLGLDTTEGATPGSMWQYIFSANPKYAKPYIHSELCPYNTGNCCIWKDGVYASTVDDNYESPDEAPDDWVKIPG